MMKGNGMATPIKIRAKDYDETFLGSDEYETYEFDDNWGKDVLKDITIGTLDFSKVNEHAILADFKNNIIKQDGLNEHTLDIGRINKLSGHISLNDADATFKGENRYDYAGSSISNAGDVNGDGYDDLLISAPGASSGRCSSGKIYLIYGKENINGEFDLSDADVTFTGKKRFEQAGSSISNAGDVNGDGYNDLLISSPGAKCGSGKVHLIYGKSNLNGEIDLSDSDVTFTGKNRFDYAGSSVSNAGDVNGDGYDDLIIGASCADPKGRSSGESYLIYGKAELSGKINLSKADVTFSGKNRYDYSGYTISNAGDVNGDGYDDLIIGASGADPNGCSSGETYLIYGKKDLGSKMSLSQADVTFTGKNRFDYSSYSISNAGDVNGDGYADLLIGASGADPNGCSSGEAYLIYGKENLDYKINLSQADVTFSGINRYDYAGSSLSNAGDVNGDGYDDILIGAYGTDSSGKNAGESYLIYGSSNLNGQIDLSLADASFAGKNKYDYSGGSLSNAGDINGDGFADIIIGASGANSNGKNAGEAYLMYGESKSIYIKELIGSQLNDSIYGYEFENNIIDAQAGNDTIQGGAKSDTIIGNAGNDMIHSKADNDSIEGGCGDDLLNGGSGVDTMNGGSGNDSYVVDNTNDVIYDNEGKDTVRSYIDYTLSDNLEKLILIGDAVNAVGNNYDNWMVGNAQDNFIQAKNGDNYIEGFAGNDSIEAGNGSDTLIGGTGADTMNGGAGNDYYFVDNMNDVIYDTNGKDKVTASVDHTLTNNIEQLQLIGFAKNAAGNSLDNLITGNAIDNIIKGNNGNDTIFAKAGNDSIIGGSGNDYLSGGSGTDTMNGGVGNDSYIVDNTNDVIYDNEGYDSVSSYIDYTLSDNLEKVILLDQAIKATGNDYDNWIVGNSLDNIIQGNKGDDALEGGKGNDTYKFNIGDGQDRIKDRGTDSQDTILFGTDVQKENIAFFAHDNTLDIKYGSEDTINIHKYNDPGFAIENIEVSSGLSVDIDSILQHIAAYEATNNIDFSNVNQVSAQSDLMQELQVYWS